MTHHVIPPARCTDRIATKRREGRPCDFILTGEDRAQRIKDAREHARRFHANAPRFIAWR